MNDFTARCNECSTSENMIDNTNTMNEYLNENLPSINVPTANDEETLNNITFGTLKQWLTTSVC